MLSCVLLLLCRYYYYWRLYIPDGIAAARYDLLNSSFVMSYVTFSFVPILMALLVFASFVIVSHDFRSWIFPLQLWILSLFMSSNTCSSHRLFGLPLALLKPGFHSCHFLHYSFFPHPSYVAVSSQPLCLYSFHNVFFLQSSLYVWVHQSLVVSSGRRFSLQFSSEIILVSLPRPLSGSLFRLHMLPLPK